MRRPTKALGSAGLGTKHPCRTRLHRRRSGGFGAGRAVAVDLVGELSAVWLGLVEVELGWRGGVEDAFDNLGGMEAGRGRAVA